MVHRHPHRCILVHCFIPTTVRVPQVLDKLFRKLADEMADLFFKGVSLPGSDTQRLHLAVLGLKGDLPFLAKTGKLTRNFQRMTDDSQRCEGICHLCFAGQPLYPFEDTSSSAEWKTTMFDADHDAFKDTPLLSSIPHGLPQTSFYKFDLFHNIQKGIGQDASASIITHLIDTGFFGQTSFDERLSTAYSDLQAFAKTVGSSLHLTRFSRDNLGIKQHSYPAGNWFKGSDTTVICKWLQHILAPRPFSSPLHTAMFQCISGLNKFVSCLYRAGLWIPLEDTLTVLEAGDLFLSAYTLCTKLAYTASPPLFLFCVKPKLHYVHHTVETLRWQVQHQFEHAYNPMSESCQMDEDLVGTTCRLARRVPVSTGIATAVGRYLLGVQAAMLDGKSKL